MGTQWGSTKMNYYSGRLKFCFILLILIYTPVTSIFYYNLGVMCPIGFQYNNMTRLCYQVKSNEISSQKYERCNGNEVSLEFINEYKYTFPNMEKNVFWTDFVRAYKNGPFINWRLDDDNMGLSAENMEIKSENGQHMCVVVHISSGEYKSANCDESHNRLCVIRPYPGSRTLSWDCPELYQAYPSPIPTCLKLVGNMASARRVPLRATWKQAFLICNKSNGYLPHRGYVYLNHEEFATLETREWPLGITVVNGHPIWNNYSSELEDVLKQEWNFASGTIPNNINGTVVLQNGMWNVENASRVYNNAVCESFIHLPTVEFNFTRQEDDKLFFQVKPSNVMIVDIWCFTDADSYVPKRVTVISLNPKINSFYIEHYGDGFYWCFTNNTSEYISRESEKQLFIKDINRLKYTFAMMLDLKHYTPNLNESEIKRFIYSHFAETERRNMSQSAENYLRMEIVMKRRYDNGRWLVHITLSNVKYELQNHQYGAFTIIYKRNVKQCYGKGSTETSDLGSTVEVPEECKQYHCAGNFNVGAYWVTTPIPNCTIVSTTHLQYPSTSESTSLSSIITSHCPEDEIDEVVNIIDEITNGPVNSSVLKTAADLISKVLDLEGGSIPKKLLNDLDRMVSKMTIQRDETHVKIVEPNLAIIVSDRNSTSPVTGIKLKPIKQGTLDDDAVHILTGGNISVPETEENDIIVNVPSSLGSGVHNDRLSFVIFKNDRAFNHDITNQSQLSRVNTRVLSVSMSNVNKFQANEYIDLHFRPYNSQGDNETKVCVFWDFSKGSNGYWSSEGCELLPAKGPGGLDTCRCNHLTHFAQLISKIDVLNRVNDVTLTIISLIGCIFSLIGLIIICLTGILFKSWRSDFSNKIWLHLSAAMSILIMTFLYIVFADMQYVGEVFCLITGVFLHYSVLASFCWMLISAVLSYQRLVTVFTKGSSHRLLKSCVFGWVAPVVPIILLFIFDSDNYTQHFKVDQLRNDFCYPNGLGFWLSVFLPIALIVAANAVLFFLIIYSVFINSNIQRHGETGQLYRSITVSFLLFFLFGLTWIFGLFSSQSIVMAYLFCLTATLQGLVLCVFFVLGNKKTRDLWLVQLRVKEKKKIPTTTSMSRSYPSRGNSKNSKPLNLRKFEDDSVTKPRSLSGTNDNSDLRFS